MGRRTRGKHPVKLPRLSYEQTQTALLHLYQVESHTGRHRRKRRKLPPESTPYTRGEIPYPAKPAPRWHGMQVDALTSGTNASLVGNDLLKERPYVWRGKANKEARKLWARISSEIPPDSFFEKQLRESGNLGVYAPGTSPDQGHMARGQAS